MVFNAFSSEVAEISRGRKKERRGGGVGGGEKCRGGSGREVNAG